MRSLFIQRINAWARSVDLKYSQVVHLLRGTELNVKMLAELAFNSPEVLHSLVKEAQAKS
jgi:ribosomal protein L20